jgi:uncharacterized protein with ATP-grasp and redox domains
MKTEHLPPYFSTGDPGSFAQKTLQVRKPAIIGKIIGANEFTEGQRQELIALKEELLYGTISDSFSPAPYSTDGLDGDSRQMWQDEMPAYVGRSWLDVPFYFAEALLYFRILIAIGYFDRRSSFYMRDPYKSFKKKELYSEAGGLAIGRALCKTIEESKDPDERSRAILHYSLWGNRVDLSLFSIAEKSRGRVLDERGENLLIDHSTELVGLIGRAARVDVILDNTGQELVSDLIAVWHVLTISPYRTVHLHAKRYPFYVSDAMVTDIDETMEALSRDSSPALNRVGKGIRSFQEQGRLHIGDNYFWNGPLHYPDLPSELLEELSRSDVVLLKGDINYRRLISDRRWRVSEDLADIAYYFPASIAMLRTMKSEAIVDIDEKYARELDAQDPEWKVNGERGIIRVVEKAAL